MTYQMMLLSEELVDQTEHDSAFVERVEEDRRAEEHEGEEDRAEETPISSSVSDITSEEDQKNKNNTLTTTPSVV